MAQISTDSFAVPDLVLEPVQPRYLNDTEASSAQSGGPALPPFSLAGVGDLDRDGRAEVAIGNSLGSGLSILFGQPLLAAAALPASGVIPEEFAFDLARPQMARRTPGPAGVHLGSQSPIDLADAYWLEGTAPQESLSQALSPGDINGDGLIDLLLFGESRGYVLLGPVNLSEQASIAEHAAFTVDFSLLGKPAERMGDVDGDGIDDLVFIKPSVNAAGQYSGTHTVNIIHGRVIFDSRVLTPSHVNQSVTLVGFTAVPRFT